MHSTLTDRPQETVYARWRANADKTPDRDAIIHWVAGEAPFRWRWGELLGAAAVQAAFLREAGVRVGDVCAIIIRHSADFYPVYMGISAIGAVPAVLAYPNPRMHPLKFRQGLEGMARRSGLSFILTEPELEPIIRPLLQVAGSTVRAILFPAALEGNASLPPLDADPRISPACPCLLQHSSGTTGLQKAVMLSHKAILEHISHYGRAIGLRPDDKVVNWLPLYHDMGLIAAFHLSLAEGVPVVMIDPFEWVLAPTLLWEAASLERCTLAWLPNFSYNFMAERVIDEDMEGIRLDSLRMLVNCSEPVRAESHDLLLRKLGPYGLRREALTACYAMAETTFAVTQTEPGHEAGRFRADRDSLAAGMARAANSDAPSRVCVSSGSPIPGCEIKVVDKDFRPLAQGQVGELAIRSVSMFDGYRNNPEKTAEVMRDGWYLSGDYGFMFDGEVFVIGRKKDIIIVAGKNLYPEDLENAIGRVADVLAGRVVAFGVEDEEKGTERVCIVAETPLLEDPQRKDLRRRIVEAGMEIDVTISRVYLAPPRWLIKSSSGKPSRKANKKRAIEELARQ